MKRNQFLKLVGATLALGLGLPLVAQAEPFPSRPLKLVVPYSPGGLPDTVARALARHLQDALGQPVFVENKPGATGAVAAATLAQSPADGYTLLVTDGPTLAIAPLLSKHMT